jgi:hypothetical protein
MENRNVEEELSLYGFKSLEKFIIEGENPFVKYIKVQSVLGETFFIHLDDVGQVCVNGQCESILAPQTGSFLPTTLRLNVAESLNLALPGIMFECNGSLCAVERQTDALQFEEHSYGPMNPEVIPPISYPIIRLSDLRRNAPTVLAVASESFRESRNVVFNRVVKDVGVQIQLQNKYVEALREFFQQMNETTKALTETIATLEKRIALFSGRDLTPTETQERDAYTYNLKVRNGWLEEVLAVGLTFVDIQRDSYHHLETLLTLNRKFDDFKLVRTMMSS